MNITHSNVFIMRAILIIISVIIVSSYSDWNTLGGNSQRTGFLNTIGPESKTNILWEGTIDGSGGCYIHISDNKVVTTRGSDYFLVDIPMVCHDLYSGELLWQRDFPGEDRSPSYAIGFQDNVIYASNWQGGIGTDTLYALNADNGDILWKNGIGIHGAPFLGCAFLENKNFLLRISSGYTACFNHLNGDTLWTIEDIPPSLPNTCNISVYKNTAYTWSSNNYGKSIIAIDVDKGEIKYDINLPTTNPSVGVLNGASPVISDDGTIFVHRCDNSLSAIKDDGTKLSISWFIPIRGGGLAEPAIGPDGSIYILNNYRVMRIDAENGNILDSSIVVFSDTAKAIDCNFAIDALGTVFTSISPPNNKLYSFKSNLKINWVDSIPVLADGGPALSSSGLLAIAGKGDLLRVYKPKDLNTTKEKLNSKDFLISNKLNSLKFLFNLDKTLDLNLSIYNIRGQQVYHSSHTVNTSGVYEIEVRELSRGQYISKVQLGNETIVKKVNVIQ